MKTTLQIAVVLFFSLCMMPYYANAEPPGKYPNKVNITYPTEGKEVGSYVIANGTSEIHDKESKVWVFNRMEFVKDKWYPQDEPKVDDKGDWKAYVHIGEKRDIGLDFKIAVATVDKKMQKKISEYFERGQQTGQWIPIPVKTTSNIGMVTVKKTSHE